MKWVLSTGGYWDGRYDKQSIHINIYVAVFNLSNNSTGWIQEEKSFVRFLNKQFCRMDTRGREFCKVLEQTILQDGYKRKRAL